jgi:hypothetical protein
MDAVDLAPDPDEAEGVPLDDASLNHRANWTIKNVPLYRKMQARNGAAKRGEPIGERVGRALDLLDAQEAGNAVLPPPRPAGRTMLTVGSDSHNLPGLPANDSAPPGRLAQLATLARIACDLTPAGKDSKAQRMARRAVCEELRAFGPVEASAESAPP